MADENGGRLSPLFPEPYLLSEKTAGAGTVVTSRDYQDGLQLETGGTKQDLEAALVSFRAAALRDDANAEQIWLARAAEIATLFKLAMMTTEGRPELLADVRKRFDPRFWALGDEVKLDPSVVHMRVLESDVHAELAMEDEPVASLLSLVRNIVKGQVFCADKDEEDWVYYRLEQAI